MHSANHKHSPVAYSGKHHKHQPWAAVKALSVVLVVNKSLPRVEVQVSLDNSSLNRPQLLVTLQYHKARGDSAEVCSVELNLQHQVSELSHHSTLRPVEASVNQHQVESSALEHLPWA